MGLKIAEARLPQTDDELHALVETLWGVRIPRQKVCPNHSAPFDAFAEAYFGRVPVSVWKGSRGLGGKSMSLALLCATEAVTLGAHITILGGSSAQSQRVHEVQQEGWEWPLAPTHKLRSSTMYMTRLTNGGWIRSLTASQRSARGPHPQRLRLDEIDEMDLAILEAAQGQPMDRIMRGRLVETQTVMSSTHQYPDRTMTEILKRAKMQGWSVHEWSLGATTQVLTPRGMVEIQNLSLKDRVMTRSGWKAIQHITLMGWKKTLVIGLSNGRTIRATPDHRFATPSGWVRAEHLLVSTTLIGISETLPAMASVVGGADVSVLGRVLVPTRAMSSCDLCGDVWGHEHVPSVGDSTQVTRIDASSVPTLVVDLQATSDRSVPQLEGEPVYESFASTSSIDDSVSVTIDGTGPLPACLDDGSMTQDIALVVDDLSCIGDSSISADFASTSLAVLPDRIEFAISACVHVVSITDGVTECVYDIGVEDEHEFVAEGVVVHNCYRESMGTPEDPGWLTQSLVDRKRSEIPKHMWDTEYDLQEPSITGRAIQTEFVELMFDTNLGTFQGDEGEHLIFQKYDHRATYITGVDWAKESDWTIVSTWRTDVTPWQRVAWFRTGRKPWPAMIRDVENRMADYGGLLVHDATGIGNVVDDFLSYPDEKVVAFVMSGRPRETMFNDYIAAIENKNLIGPRIDYSYAEHKYVTWDDLYGRGHAPDSFVADSLAWGQRNIRIVVPAAGNVVRTGGSPWRQG